MIKLVSTAFFAFALSFISAEAKSSLGSFDANGNGITKKACKSQLEQNADRRAWEIALTSLETPSSYAQCMMAKKSKAVDWKMVNFSYDGEKSCSGQFEGGYDRSDVLELSRDCTKISNGDFTVGVLLRAEINGFSDISVAERAIGNLATQLAKNNFNIINLNQFGAQLQDLSILQECAYTGADEAENTNDRCQLKVDNYAEARDNLAAKLRKSVQEYKKDDPALSQWDRCGAWMIVGEIVVTTDEYDVQAAINIDYLNLSQLATTRAPFAEEIVGEIDLGGRSGAIKEVVSELVFSSALDSSQKLALSAHSNNCSS